MKIKMGAGRLSMSDIACFTGCGCTGNVSLNFEYVCTDSREADKDSLFVAFKGERVDGHDYIPAAYNLGCRCFLVERADTVPADSCALVVEDSTAALIKISKACGDRVDCVRIGITGSVGKTTTKEFVACVASRRYNTHKTFGNYNSTIGMPLTLMETPEDTGVSVLEMAMSGLGEISQMSCAANPDIAIITNIGSSHMEALGSKQNILKAKLEITDGLSSDGYLIINGDDPMLAEQTYSIDHVLKIGIKNQASDYYAYNIKTTEDGTCFDIRHGNEAIENIKIPTIGEHNVYAALIAVAVGGIIGIDGSDLRDGLASYKSVGLRQRIVSIGELTVIEDCYNASPESMRAAINVLRTVKHADGRAIALLGDMRELGSNSDIFHREIGRYVFEHNIDLLFTIGGAARHIAAGAVEAGMSDENVFVNVDEETYAATAWEIWRQVKAGDVLLVKASRAIRAERVIEQLKRLESSN